MATPLTPEEMARFNAQFGLAPPMPAGPAMLPPPEQVPLSNLRPGSQEALAGLNLPPGVSGQTAMELPSLKPGQVADFGAPEPIAPSPPAALDGPGMPRMPGHGEGAGPPMQLSYPPARMVPGGWQSAERVTEGAHEVPEEAKQLQNFGLRQQQSGINVAREGERAQASQEAAQLGATADAYNDQIAEIRARESRRASDMEQARVRYETAVEGAAKQAEVSPGRIWAGGGGGAAAALATIGVALGQFGASLNGGPNTAMQMIEGMIDRDLQSQRDNLAKAQNNVAAQKGVLGEMRANFGDERQADIAAKDALLLTTDLKLKQFAAEAKDPAAKARALDLSGQLTQRRGALLQQWSATEEGNIRLREKYTPAHMVGGPPGAGTVATKEADSRLITLDDGSRLQLKDEKAATKAADMLTSVRKVEKLANDLDKVRAQVGTYVPGTKGAAEAQRLGGQLLFAIKDAEQTGALDKGSVAIIESTLGTPDGIFSRAGQKALGYAKDARGSFNEYLKANGARQIREGYARDQGGAVVPTQAFEGKSVASALVPKGFRAAGGVEAPAQPKMPTTKQFDPDAVGRVLTERKKGSKK